MCFQRGNVVYVYSISANGNCVCEGICGLFHDAVQLAQDLQIQHNLLPFKRLVVIMNEGGEVLYRTQWQANKIFCETDPIN
jgi:hypothetical protein